MLSQGVIENAKHMGNKLGVGSSQPRLYFDNGDEALLEVLKGEINEWSCNFLCYLVLGTAEAIPTLLLAIVRSPPESRCRHA